MSGNKSSMSTATSATKRQTAFSVTLPITIDSSTPSIPIISVGKSKCFTLLPGGNWTEGQFPAKTGISADSELYFKSKLDVIQGAIEASGTGTSASDLMLSHITMDDLGSGMGGLYTGQAKYWFKAKDLTAPVTKTECVTDEDEDPLVKCRKCGGWVDRGWLCDCDDTRAAINEESLD